MYKKGFSLIEVLLVVAIIGVIAAIAIPQYSEYVRKARRSQCQSEMLNAATRLERQYSVQSKYPTDDDTIKAVAGLSECPKGDATSFYEVGYESDGQTFTITATRANAQKSDEKCGDLTLNQLGQKGLIIDGKEVKTGDIMTVCWR